MNGSNSYLYSLLLQLTQSIHRIFPFPRGLFEDKVANVWCAIHTLHKLNTYSIPLLQRVSLLSTIDVFNNPQYNSGIPLAMFSSL